MPDRMDRLDRRIAETKHSIAVHVARLRRQVEHRQWATQREAIRALVRARRITTVYHFTPVDNLSGICERGLVSRAQALALNDPRTVYPDGRRNDQATWAVCCSVSWPNYLMRYTKEHEQGLTFAVIALDACVLWEKDCVFVPGNAARADLAPYIRGMRLDWRNRFRQLSALFPQPDPRPEEWWAYPTDVQAEVLIGDPPVELSYVKALYFNSVAAMRRAESLPWPTLVDCWYNPGVFRPRPDQTIVLAR